MNVVMYVNVYRRNVFDHKVLDFKASKSSPSPTLRPKKKV